VLPDRVWLVTPDADVTAVVMEIVAGRTFLADARFTLLPLEVARVVGTTADAEPSVIARRAFEGATGVPTAGRVRSAPSGSTMLAADAHGALLLAGPALEVADLERRLLAAGVPPGDAASLDTWRVVTGRPAWGREVAPPHLPEELGLLPTHVHLAKGCYPGQEAVARMWMLGRPRRRLAEVDVRGAPAVAGRTIGEGREQATLTTVLPGLERALAVVPGSAQPGDRFEAPDDVVLEVVRIVGDDPVPPGHDPAMRRRRDRPRTE
jgi:tRNA-modifying protein YgfZ